MKEYLLFALTGRLLVYLIQKFPLSTWLSKRVRFLEELFSCDLCLGVWVYSIINIILFNVNIFDGNNIKILSEVLGEIVTGAITSFIMHLIVIGWNTKFAEIVIGYTEKEE